MPAGKLHRPLVGSLALHSKQSLLHFRENKSEGTFQQESVAPAFPYVEGFGRANREQAAFSFFALLKSIVVIIVVWYNQGRMT
jgi:hypothetical protein